jgi:multidrug efflux system membrane fusion protein
MSAHSLPTPRRGGRPSGPRAHYRLFAWLASLSLVSACLLLPGCGQGDGPDKQPQHPPAPVGLTKAEAQDLPVLLRAVGAVESMVNIKLTAQVNGQLLKAHFKEGHLVKQGDLLFSIDPRAYHTALKVAQANLKKDQAQLHDYQSELNRKQPLVQRQFISQQDFNQLTAKVAAQAATVEADQAQVEKAELDLSYCQIKAPFTGRVDRMQAHPGSYVTAGNTVLVDMASYDPIYVKFSLPETEMIELRGRQITGPLKVEVWPMGAEAQPQTGRLEFLANEVNQSTGSIIGRAIFANAQGVLWPGQSLQVAVTLFVEKNAVVVPTQAVQQGPKGNYVFAVGADDVAQIRPVTVSRQAGSLSVVAEGLTPGQEVVVDGHILLFPGAKVVRKALPKLDESLAAQKTSPAAPAK